MSYLNDPRVLFAAERTLLAWNRTSVSLIAMGFVIERFGLFINAMHLSDSSGQRHLSFIIGLTLIAFASVMSVLSIFQFRRILKRLAPDEVPHGYMLWCGTATNLVVALLGAVLVFYLLRGIIPL